MRRGCRIEQILSFCKHIEKSTVLVYNIYDAGQRRLPFLILGVNLQKGGSSMESMVIIDWKFVVALGAVAVGVIFAVKMDASAAKEVSIHAVDAAKEYAIAKSGC